MNLSQLEVFVALAEIGRFNDAADRVGITRSAASHAIANLEAELGVPLLERERGNATPTAIGGCLLHHAHNILASVEAIQQEAASARGLQAGKLRIGIVSSVSATLLSGILSKFRQEYSGIELVTFEGTGQEVENWIRTSVVDVGFVLRQAEDIDITLIGRDEVRVLVSSGHPLRYTRVIDLERLMREPFIQPKMACDFIDSNQLGHQQIEPHKRYEVTEVQAVLAMVREGLGFSLLPNMLLPHHMDGLHLLSLDPPMHFMFGVGLRSQRNASPAARMFIQVAQFWAVRLGLSEAEPQLTTTP